MPALLSPRLHEGARGRRAAGRRGTGKLPIWWTGFAAYLADRLAPDRAILLLRLLAPRLRAVTGPAAALTATAAAAPREQRAGPATARLLHPRPDDAARRPGPSPARAAASRAKRIVEVPCGFRDPAAAFDSAPLQARDRSRRTGTKPRSDKTLEINLTAARDLVRFLTTDRPAVNSWRLVTRDDVEAFLAGVVCLALLIYCQWE